MRRERGCGSPAVGFDFLLDVAGERGVSGLCGDGAVDVQDAGDDAVNPQRDGQVQDGADGFPGSFEVPCADACDGEVGSRACLVSERLLFVGCLLVGGNGVGGEMNFTLDEHRNGAIMSWFVRIVMQPMMQSGHGCEGIQEKNDHQAQQRDCLFDGKTQL